MIMKEEVHLIFSQTSITYWRTFTLATFCWYNSALANDFEEVKERSDQLMRVKNNYVSIIVMKSTTFTLTVFTLERQK